MFGIMFGIISSATAAALRCLMCCLHHMQQPLALFVPTSAAPIYIGAVPQQQEAAAWSASTPPAGIHNINQQVCTARLTVAHGDVRLSLPAVTVPLGACLVGSRQAWDGRQQRQPEKLATGQDRHFEDNALFGGVNMCSHALEVGRGVASTPQCSLRGSRASGVKHAGLMYRHRPWSVC
jgi:hypothetical protein